MIDWLSKYISTITEAFGPLVKDVIGWLYQQYKQTKTSEQPARGTSTETGIAIANRRNYGIFIDKSTTIINIAGSNQKISKDNEIKKVPRPEPNTIVKQTHLDEFAEQELSKILSLRVFGHIDTKQNIQVLRRRVVYGNDLSDVSASVKHKINYWTARLCASDTNTLDIAKQTLEELHSPAPDLDVSIVDALLAETKGDKDKALRILRDHDDPDSKATLFALLARLKDERDALDWFQEQENHNEPDFVTSIGWFNWAMIMAKLGKWKEASKQLVTLNEYWSDMPALALIEGQVSAAMLLPDDFRGMVLEGPPLYTGITPDQGSDKKDFHVRATECFEYFSQHPVVRDDSQFTKFVIDWKLWLRLMSPIKTNVNAAHKEIRQLMEAGDAKAVDIIDFAHVFNIPYDIKPLQKYLEQRKDIGGLDNYELNAECLLNEQVMSPGDRVIYLEQHQARLRKIMPLSFIVAMQIAALVEDDQTDKARALVEKHTVEIGEMRSRYLFAIISRHEGNDNRQQLENLYDKEKSLAALQSLVSCLKRLGDRTALLPYARDLFERVRNENNALNVIWCLGDQSYFDQEATLEFLNSNNDIVEQSTDLQEVKAFALFYAGQFQEAKQVNDTLISIRDMQSDRNLDINIAVCSGDWEHILTIIEQAWPERDTSEPRFLISLAELTSQQDKTPERALELARLAANKAPNDPHILASAYWLHFQLGHEDEVDPNWLKQATVHSSGDDSPLRAVSLKEIVTDLIPKRQEHLYEIEKMWSRGELPTNVAAGIFNMSMTHLILQDSAINTVKSDAKRRPMLPLITGGSAPVEIKDNWTIALDITSIMALTKLGLLEQSLNTFQHIKLSPNVMELLFQEKVKARFHQPSRIEAAKQVQQLLNRGQLRAIDRQATPPPNITSEVGPDLAALLQAARDTEGKVICFLPIYKAGSLLEQHADTSSHDDLIITATDLCVLLYKEGKIDTKDYERAIQYFKSSGQPERTNLPPSVLNKTIYIDRSVVFYLQDVDLLRLIGVAGLDIQVHPNILEEQYALIEAGDTGEELIQKIENIRRILRGAAISGSASFLPRRDGLNEQNRNIDIQLESIGQLWGGNDAYDAICIDDRFYNKYPALTGPTGKTVPIVCILDVLRYFLNQNRISIAEYWGFRHTLRHGGFAFIPLEADELIHWLKRAQFDSSQLKESLELREIRQAQAHFGASGLATSAEAQALFAHTSILYGQVIIRLWEDEAMVPEQAALLSDWVYRQLLPTVIIIPQHLAQDAYRSLIRELMSITLVRLFAPLNIQLAQERRAQYTHWLDASVLQPLRFANADIIKKALISAHEMISGLDRAFQQEIQHKIGNIFLQQLPDVERSLAITQAPDFAERCGFMLDYLLTIGPNTELEGSALFAAVKDVFATDKEITVQDKDGKSVSIGLADDRSIIVELASNKDDEMPQKVTVPELSLLSPNPEIRIAALSNVIDRLGPTEPDYGHLIEEIASREITPQELSKIFNKITNSVAHLQARLVQRISQGVNFTAEDVIPQSIFYFERFAGPPPSSQDPESYFKEVLIPYRRNLLNRDLLAGLDICCLGALSDELAPGQWVSEIDNNRLWSAFNNCHANSNPFSLLGALDTAMYRQDDPRFQGFAEEAVTQLLDKNFGQQEGTDFYRLLQVTANFVINRVHLLDGGHKYPSYWKRIGAWMQAGLFVRPIAESNAEIDVDEFQNWAQDNMYSDGVIAEFVNGWKETPPIIAHTSQSVRDEIFGRLLALKLRHEKEGRQLAALENLNHVLDQYRNEGISSIVSTSENILCQQPLTETLPQDLSQKLEEIWPGNTKNFWESLTAYSQFYVLGIAELERARDTMKTLANNIEDVEKGEILMYLQLAGIVAATSRDTKLADDILNVLIKIVPAIDKDELFIILLMMLRTSGAHQSQQAWFEWLDNGLKEITARLPSSPNEILSVYIQHLDLIGAVFPVESWFYIRARSIASARSYK